MFFDSRLAFDVTDSRLFAYVGLGSNLGDRAGYLLLAVRGMMDAGLMVTRLSSIYETEPVDVREQPAFLNMVAELRVQIFSPEQTLARLLRIEYALGRRRDTPRGPRTVDLDLLLYGDEQSATGFLQLPHPRLHERRFVLTPLAELAPELLHPTLQRSIRQLLARTDDEAEVKTWRATRETRGHGDAETRRKEKNG
ncbi:MAG TPA: 2-amino-4-hydroxy-6-hydroxymethyldihydropteridine diphosphokinase [Pyrinomonadaceae bacterium]|jgi:2-amino-4-hydroxy-6-hydroxymethyldihydropteridine diphosphokinase|nr:2-amino-4-hydroxy-6-hydroxymethyldihydropteridine diphosphokinase [Pyrinomonadaceae bacterium]